MEINISNRYIMEINVHFPVRKLLFTLYPITTTISIHIPVYLPVYPRFGWFKLCHLQRLKGGIGSSQSMPDVLSGISIKKKRWFDERQKVSSAKIQVNNGKPW